MNSSERLLNLLKIANYQSAQRRDQLARCQERLLYAEKLAADRKRTIELLRQERKCLLAQLAIQERENQLLESLYAPTQTAQVHVEEGAPDRAEETPGTAQGLTDQAPGEHAEG
jgi:hypothetical protein